MVIKAIIADDEAPARDELLYLLNEIGGVEVVGQAQNAAETLKLAKTVAHNTLFLDVQMPGLNGIEAASKLQDICDHSPCIIFVTAYNEYALPAFQVNAVDYILKPVEFSRLNKTVDRVRNLLRLKESSASPLAGKKEESGGGVLKRVVVKKDNRLVLINVEDICHVWALEGDVYVSTQKDKFLAPTTIKELEKKLPAQTFFRTHRGCLVNLNFVREISPFFSGTYIMRLGDEAGSEIQVSRKQTRKLKQLLAI